MERNRYLQNVGSRGMIKQLGMYVVISSAVTVANALLNHRYTSLYSQADSMRLIAELLSVLAVFSIGLQMLLAQSAHSESEGRVGSAGLTFLLKNLKQVFVSILGGVLFFGFASSWQINDWEIPILFLLVLVVTVIVAHFQAVLLRHAGWNRLTSALIVTLAIRSMFVFSGVGTEGSSVLLVHLMSVLGSLSVLVVSSPVDKNQFVQSASGVHLGTRSFQILVMAMLAVTATPSVLSLVDWNGSSNNIADFTRPSFVSALFVAYLLTPDLCSGSLGSWRSRRSFRFAYVLGASYSFIFLIGSWMIVGITPLRNQVPNSMTSILFSLGYFGLGLLAVPTLLLTLYSTRTTAVLLLPILTPVIVNNLTTQKGGLITWVFCIAAAVVVINMKVIRNTLSSNQTLLFDPDQEMTDFDGIIPTISIVIPSFNPGTAIGAHVYEIVRECKRLATNLEVIVVSDGSKDESVELLDSIDFEGFQHVRLRTNTGKGFALREGMSRAKGDYVGFIDADGDIPAEVLSALLAALIQTDSHIAFASKTHGESFISVSRLRKVVSSIFQRILRLLFDLDVQDTQTGAKMFSRKVLNSVLPTLRENGFSFDVEFFVSASNRGFRQFVEVPVRIIRTGDSTVSLLRTFQTFTELLRIFVRSRILLDYEVHTEDIGGSR